MDVLHAGYEEFLLLALFIGFPLLKALFDIYTFWGMVWVFPSS